MIDPDSVHPVSLYKRMADNLNKPDWLKTKYLIEKLSSPTIARLCGVSKETIRMKIHKFGIPIRAQGFGSEANNWKGGERRHAEGYIWVWSRGHPHADCHGYVRRSRLVMEKMLGRYLKNGEVVHHRNGIKDDDRPENLRLFQSQNAHSSFHRPHDSWHEQPKNSMGQWIKTEKPKEICLDCSDTGYVGIDTGGGNSRKAFCACAKGRELLAEADEKAREANI